MEIVVRGQNVPVSDTLVAHCISRAGRGLRPYSSRISRVEFVFVDLNGPKSGLGHACRATVDFSRGGHVRYEARAGDYYQALSQSVAGLARQVERVLGRRRSYASERPTNPTPPLPPAA